MNNIVLFVSTEEFDPISALIREKTECSWSHVGFYRLSDQMTFSAMCDGKGVAWRPVKPSQKMLLLDCSAPEAAAKALACALTQAGKAYNTLDIAGIALARDWSSANQFICSTLVLWAFEQINFPLINMEFIPLEHLTPRDVLLSNLLTARKAQ